MRPRRHRRRNRRARVESADAAKDGHTVTSAATKAAGDLWADLVRGGLGARIPNGGPKAEGGVDPGGATMRRALQDGMRWSSRRSPRGRVPSAAFSARKTMVAGLAGMTPAYCSPEQAAAASSRDAKEPARITPLRGLRRHHRRRLPGRRRSAGQRVPGLTMAHAVGDVLRVASGGERRSAPAHAQLEANTLP